MDPKATIKDVARDACVAASTVSRVLSGKSVISEETKKRVMKSVERLGYTPNTAARRLRCDKSGIIGVVLPDISGEFYSACAAGVLYRARQLGYSVLLVDTARDTGAEQEDIKALLEMRVDGIIFIGGKNDDSIIKEVCGREIPVVMGDRVMDGVPSVSYNNRYTTGCLVDALYDEGIRNIAYMGEPVDIQTNLCERFMGYMDSVNSHKDMSHREIFDIRMSENKIKAGFDICREQFSKTQPEAVITANDLIAQGILSAAGQMGIQICVSGFDDRKASAYWTPSVTTVAQDTDELAYGCFDLLMDVINKREVHDIVLKQRVIIRDSLHIGKETLKKYGL